MQSASASEPREELFGRAWLDIESEPVSSSSWYLSSFSSIDGHLQKVFQEIVCSLGATGINVQELYGLDDESTAMLK